MQRQIERALQLMGDPDIRLKDPRALLADLYLRLRAYAAEDHPEGRSPNLIVVEFGGRGAGFVGVRHRQ
jgi:hypothetical protein